MQSRNVPTPVEDRDVGSSTLVRKAHWEKAEPPISLTPVGIDTDTIEQPEKALSPIDEMVVEMTMAPLQHASDGVFLFTQPMIGTYVGDADGSYVGIVGAADGSAVGLADGCLLCGDVVIYDALVVIR